MRFGVFYELQLPRPWAEGDEHRLFKEALEQVVLADRLGFDYAWDVEHHFLDEYSHSSAPEVFLAAAAARTSRIRLGHGIRQVIPNYNHPARTAEGLATLDLLSDGRVEFGIGEGATRLELGAFGISARSKRALALEAAEQICNMMTLTPYPGFEGEGFPATPGFGLVLVEDSADTFKGVLIYDLDPPQGLPQLGLVTGGTGTIPLYGARVAWGAVSEPRCPLFARVDTVTTP